MAIVSILGRGTMGSAIAGVVEKAGGTVESFGSKDTDRLITGDIVVLAVPYPAVSDVLGQRRDELAGKIVVDITNPLDFQTFDALTVPADASATAEIAAALPQSRVIKGFNTNFAATLTSGSVGGAPTTVLIAGDDAEAKTQLAEIIAAAGLRAVDAGSLRRARELEALGFLQITLAAQEKTSWAGGFALQA
jgi:NADPH-dependent F420 reductase